MSDPERPAPDRQALDRQALVRAAAHEVLLRRMIRELEMEVPGFIERLAGPYEPSGRRGEVFDAFLAEVDDHISLLLSQVRTEIDES
ncbi:hypothetical protein [Phenylobacterium zucineum]|uniref:hypothetical protein n=1 Tax=Phenylobacterium zucineum TaxID=284016 RepID=UPI00031DF2DE|nr:hypothetical protein [Phenylobacterium zucineum]